MASVTRRYARAGRAALVVAMVSAGAGLLSGTTPAGAAGTTHPPTLTAATPANGIAGTRVTLTGTNLLTETAVHFGKVKATAVTVKSAGKLIATAPPGKGTVNVSVTTPTGTSNTEPFTYKPPTLTGATPANGIAGTRVTLTGTNLLTETAVHFGKVKATAVTVKSAGKLIATAPPGKGTVNVSVTGPTGSSNTEPFAYDAPVVSSLAPLKGAPGTVVTVRGTGFSATAEVRFDGQTVAGVIVKSATVATFPVPTIGTSGSSVKVVVRTSAGNSAAVSFTYVPPAPLKITTTGLPGAITTRLYLGATLEASGGTHHYTWSVGSGFPQGLSLTTTSGEISGRVGAAGSYSFVVTAEDGKGATATKHLSIAVTAGPFQVETQTLPTASLDSPYSTALEDDPAVYFPPTQHWTRWAQSGLPAGLSITTYWGTISGSPSVTGRFPVTVTVTLLGQYFATRTFTLVVQAFHITTTRIAAFTSTLWGHTGPTTLAASTAGGAVQWSASGLPAGLHLTPTSGTITGAPGRGGATVGTHTFTATATDGTGATTSQAVTVQILQGSFAITTTGVGPAYLDTYDAVGLTAYGQPDYAPPSDGLTSWSATGLPAGLSITPVFGTISGTPTSTGTSQVTVTDVNVGAFFAVVTFTLSVLAFHITTSTLAGWTTDLPTPTTAGATQLAATGGTGRYTWSVGAGFPQGLTLTSSGAIEAEPVTGLPGAPVAAGTYRFTVTATDGEGGASQKAFTLVVTQGTFEIGAVASQRADEASTYELSLSDNFPPPTDGPTLWFATGLPSGLTITEISGAISGTPTTLGTSAVTVRATFAFGALWASRQFTIDVYPALSITTATLPDGTKYIPYDFQSLAATGGTGTYSWSATGLPAGIHITASTGTISGVPSAITGALTRTNVHVTVRDEGDGSATKSFTLLVGANIPVLSVDRGAAGTEDTATVTGSFPTAKVVWGGALLPEQATVSSGKTSISFAIPPGTGTPTVYVLLQGTTASTSTRFAYSATPGLFQTTPAPSGKTGAHVELHGSGFVAGDTVTLTTTIQSTVFTGTGVSEPGKGVTVSAPTTLTFVVPKEIGATVWLYVTAPGGTQSNAILFTFAYAPAIRLAYFIPGGTIALTGNGFTDTMTVTWPKSTCPLTRVWVGASHQRSTYTLREGYLSDTHTTLSGVTIYPPTQDGFCGLYSLSEGVQVTNRFGSEFLAFATFAALDTQTLYPPHPTPTTGWSELF